MMPLSLATKITLLSPWLSILGKEIGVHRIAFSMSDKLPMRSSRRLVTGSRHVGHGHLRCPPILGSRSPHR
jgi:hypothetical protein